jgi:hypothetical protein
MLEISKWPTEGYEVVTDQGLARIALSRREVRRPDGTTQYGGDLFIRSTLFGNFNCGWDDCGEPIEKHLAGADFDYFMRSTRGATAMQFDADTTITKVQKKILEWQSDQVDAETINSDIISVICDHLTDQKGRIKDERDFDDVIKEMHGWQVPCVAVFEYPEQYHAMKPVPETVEFWQTLWPLLLVALAHSGND